MKKQGLIVCVLSCLAIPAPPCVAEDSMARKVAALPVRAAGCFFALAVGTPIAIGRLSAERYHEYVSDVDDMETGSPAPRKGGVIYAIPMGFGEGVAHGLYYGPRNAIANFDKPFSKAALSLGNSPDGN